MIYIKITGILENSLVNGPGLRYVIFTQGCKHHCEGCQNSHTWDFNAGVEMNINDIIKDIKKNIPIISGVTLSGGDPLEQPEEILDLILKIKKELDLNIWCYTGYTLKELKDKNNIIINKILNNIDVLVDGKFDKNKVKNTSKYAGSSNQQIINLKK